MTTEPDTPETRAVIEVIYEAWYPEQYWAEIGGDPYEIGRSAFMKGYETGRASASRREDTPDSGEPQQESLAALVADVIAEHGSPSPEDYAWADEALDTAGGYLVFIEPADGVRGTTISIPGLPYDKVWPECGDTIPALTALIAVLSGNDPEYVLPSFHVIEERLPDHIRAQIEDSRRHPEQMIPWDVVKERRASRREPGQ